MNFPKLGLIRTGLSLFLLAAGPLGILTLARDQLELGLVLCVLLILLGPYVAPRAARRLYTVMLIAVTIGACIDLGFRDQFATWVSRHLSPARQRPGILILGAFSYIVGVGITWFCLWLVAAAGADFLIGLSTLLQDKAGAVRRFLIEQYLGIGQSYYIVDNGEVSHTKPSGVLSGLGGRGLLIVKPSNSVVTEWGGNIKNVFGPGIFWTERFEQIKQVLDLNQQRVEFDVSAQTREGVTLGARVLAYYQIKPAPKASAATATEGVSEAAESANKPPDRLVRRWLSWWPRRTGQVAMGGAKAKPPYSDARAHALKLGLPQPKAQPINVEAVLQVTYCASDQGWKRRAADDIKVAVMETINQRSIGELYILNTSKPKSAAALTTLSRNAQRRANRRTCEWGVTVRSLTITSLEAPLEVRDRTLRPITAAADAEVLGARGQAEVDLTKILEGVRSQMRTGEVDRIVALLEKYKDRIPADQLLRAVAISERLAGAIARQTPEDSWRLIQSAEDAIARLIGK